MSHSQIPVERRHDKRGLSNAASAPNPQIDPFGYFLCDLLISGSIVTKYQFR